MEYLELKEPGASVALLVQKVERRKSKFGEDYALIGNVEPNRQASVSVPEKAMERQMEKILKISDVNDLKGRFVVVSRSDEPGPNGKLYWNVEWANEDTFAGADYGEELKRDPTGRGDAPAAKPITHPAAPVQRELSESQQRPAVSEPVTERELTDAEKKKRARMSELRRVWHALWESEAEFQVLASLRVVEKIRKEHPEHGNDVFTITIDGSSVNAGCASQFIKFDRENLI